MSILYFLFFIVIILLLDLYSKVGTLQSKIKELIKQYANFAILYDKVNSLTSKIDRIINKETDSEMPNVQNHQPPEYEMTHKNAEENSVIPESKEEIETPTTHETNVQQNAKIYNNDKPSKMHEEFDIQRALLGNVFNKIGAIAIIIALIILIKLVSPFIVLTDLMKTIIAYAAGLTLIGLGLHFHKKDNFKNYAEVLLGTGFADLFITTFCGYSIFHVLNMPATITVGTIVLITTFLIADKMKTLSMIIIGLLGGYMTPFISNFEINMLLAYLIFINAISIIYTLRNKRSNWINFTNLFITMTLFLILVYNTGSINMVYPIVLWGIYIVYDLLRERNNMTDNALSCANFVVLTLFSCILFKDAYNGLSILIGITALLYLCLIYFAKKSENQVYKFYEYSFIVDLWLLGIFLFDDIQRIIYWSVLSVIIAVVISKFDAKHLKGGLIWYYITILIGTLTARYEGDNCLVANYSPIFNMRLLLFVFPVSSMLISSYAVKNYSEKMRTMLMFGGISMAYIYLTGEINSMIHTYAKGESYYNYHQTMMNIIIGFVYALNTKMLGKLNKSKIFNVAGTAIFALSTFALILNSGISHDSYLIILNLKIAAFIFAIASCFMFAKWDNNDIYKYIGLLMGFLTCHSESSQISDMFSKMGYIVSLSWILYSGITTIVGIIFNKKYAINMGIFLIIISILRIFMYDLAKVDAIYKLIAFFALGVILMVVSYIYAKYKKQQ